MSTNNTNKKIILISALITFFALSANAALISRIKTFSDGEILTASDLNSEFSNVVDGVNSISDANVIAGAAIAPSKISATIAGSGLSRDSGSGALSVSVDNSSLEINSGTLRIKSTAVGTGLAGGSGSIINVLIDNNTIGVLPSPSPTPALYVKDGGIGTTQIANGAVTPAKKAALGQQLSSSSTSFSLNTAGVETDITNMTVTITTTGRPVFIGLVPDGDTTNASNIYIFRTGHIEALALVNLYRGVTKIAVNAISHYDGAATTAGNRIPVSSLWFIDTPGAGTYTYKLTAKIATSGDLFEVRQAKMVAYEL